MKVTGANATGSTAGPRPARSAGAGFQLPSVGHPAEAGQPAAAAGVAGLMGVDALLALQDVGGPLERRRRAVRRAGRLLDALDGVKLALLGDSLSARELERLRRALQEERGATADPQLESVLDEIELRAAVEIAKLEKAQEAA